MVEGQGKVYYDPINIRNADLEQMDGRDVQDGVFQIKDQWGAFSVNFKLHFGLTKTEDLMIRARMKTLGVDVNPEFGGFRSMSYNHLSENAKYTWPFKVN